MEDWFAQDYKLWYLPLFVYWSVWKSRNMGILEDKGVSLYNTVNQVENLMHSYPVPDKKKKIKIIGSTPVLVFPYGFFDGATIDKLGGAGFVLSISNVHTFNIKIGCGHNMNSRAELLALWALLHFDLGMGLPTLHIFGDSPVIID